jgi:8-oxo-dGTP pyrophosphatase MutT (NUDIX family)
MASSEKATVFASGYLIFRRSRSLQFLLMKHPDRWDLPKGHVDPGESIFDAAKRELWEETAIPFDALWTDPTFAFVNRYWVSKRKTPESRSCRLKDQLSVYQIGHGRGPTSPAMRGFDRGPRRAANGGTATPQVTAPRCVSSTAG